jgi:serine/threonine protein kinase
MPVGPGSRLDAYEIVRPLGSGGMGEVWLATEVRLGRKVALKLLPTDLTREPSRVLRFEQEARAASALSHPNVCTILALGETSDGLRYIAMEYVEGETLRQRLARTRLSITADALRQPEPDDLASAGSERDRRCLVGVLRFEQEARTASALTHPNVCTIHALGETAEG